MGDGPGRERGQQRQKEGGSPVGSGEGHARRAGRKTGMGFCSMAQGEVAWQCSSRTATGPDAHWSVRAEEERPAESRGEVKTVWRKEGAVEVVRGELGVSFEGGANQFAVTTWIRKEVSSRRLWVFQSEELSERWGYLPRLKK